MSMKNLCLIVTFALVLGSTPVMADEAVCDEAEANKLFAQLDQYLTENPDKQDKVPEAAQTVEKDYGGEPPVEKRCEALGKLIKELEDM